MSGSDQARATCGEEGEHQSHEVVMSPDGGWRCSGRGRYLTKGEKHRVMTETSWGALDYEVAMLCRRLCRLPGVVTVQSCGGQVRKTGAGETCVESAHVEMRLDARATERFRQAQPALAACDGFEDAALHWRAGEERALVAWRPGTEDVPDALEAALGHVGPDASHAADDVAPPRYRSALDERVTDLMTCVECGCHVGDRSAHDRWHERVDHPLVHVVSRGSG